MSEEQKQSSNIDRHIEFLEVKIKALQPIMETYLERILLNDNVDTEFLEEQALNLFYYVMLKDPENKTLSELGMFVNRFNTVKMHPPKNQEIGFILIRLIDFNLPKLKFNTEIDGCCKNKPPQGMYM
jgi:hypothetical protein